MLPYKSETIIFIFKNISKFINEIHNTEEITFEQNKYEYETTVSIYMKTNSLCKKYLSYARK